MTGRIFWETTTAEPWRAFAPGRFSPVHWLAFSRNGQDVGFALAAVFTGEDGKCFILEFCVLPEHRGGGMGTACARTLLNWREQGAGYAELNCTTPPRQRFWGRLGFVANGADEWGVPLMLLPPREHRPITVERLTDPTDWQLGKLENGYRQDIGEEPLTEEQQERLTQAVREGRITFLVARRDGRAVGMCSVAEIFSTFACGPVGQLEDFYVEPVFRRRGVARQLVQAAQALCWERSIASLTVCCAPCDEAMHRHWGSLRLWAGRWPGCRKNNAKNAPASFGRGVPLYLALVPLYPGLSRRYIRR